MSTNKVKARKKRLSRGQTIGLKVIIAGVGIPSFFWGLAYWRDATKTYCSGECATGWMAVVSTWLAFPTIALGLAILGISTAAKSKK